VLRRLGKKTAANWLNDVLTGTALLNPTPEDYHAAIKRVLAFPDQPITLFDATLAVMSRRLDVEIWTYDHHFDIMQAAVWRGSPD
jgi:predicted nucleic acid-binding protein